MPLLSDMLAKQTHQKLMIEEMAIETAIKEGYWSYLLICKSTRNYV